MSSAWVSHGCSGEREREQKVERDLAAELDY